MNQAETIVEVPASTAYEAEVVTGVSRTSMVSTVRTWVCHAGRFTTRRRQPPRDPSK
jgi:hypothetical protein